MKPLLNENAREGSTTDRPLVLVDATPTHLVPWRGVTGGPEGEGRARVLQVHRPMTGQHATYGLNEPTSHLIRP